MRRLTDSCRARVAATMLLAGLCLCWSGCQDRPQIRLVPVFPADEPDLLARAGVVRLQLQPWQIVDQVPVESPKTVVEQGESFSLKLAIGDWYVEVQGVDESGEEVVFGRTPTFQVRRGKGGEVKLFLGRSMAFNLVDLEPPELAAVLGDLREHSATAFVDQGGHPWILVAGGRLPDNPEEPMALALLIDPVAFTVEQLPSLSCARSGHTGFAVQTAEGPRVVLAGGDEPSGACRSSLDVYDPISRAFQRIDPFGAADRVAVAVPEITKSGQSAVHTGRVVVSGNPRHVVDLLTGEIETGPQLSSGPGDPRVSAANAQGHVLVITDDMLFVDKAVQNAAQCYDQGGWDEAAVFGPVEGRGGGELFRLADDNFLYVGGLSADGAEPEFGWSLVSIGDCSIEKHGQGRRRPGPLPTHGFSLIDLLPEDGVGLLVAGGWSAAGVPVSRVVLMTLPGNVSVPTWHRVSSGAHEPRIALRRPRAGHAAVQAPHDGTWWVIGGGEDHRPEIFVRGTGQLEPKMELFDRRRPPLTAMTVLDTTPGTTPLNTDVATAYPAELFGQALDFSTLLFVSGRADMGIGDGLLTEVAEGDNAHCTEVADPGFAGVATGEIPNEDLETIIDVLTGNSPEVAKQTKDIAVENLLDLAQIDTENDEKWGCAWRQLLRVGVAGLRRAGADGEYYPGLDVTLGVNVLLLVTTHDDCSQSFYGQLEDPPPPEVLADNFCTSTADGASDAFDDYFGLPPSAAKQEQFTAMIDELVWDRDDLIVALVGHTTGEGTEECQAAGYGDLHRPRRLLETLEFVEGLGAQTELVEACGTGDKPPLVEALAAVGDRIRTRTPMQACVPAGITEVEPEYAVHDGQTRLVPEDPESERAVKVAEDVAQRCWLVFKEVVEDSGYDDVDVWIGVTVAADSDVWWTGTNSDGTLEDCEWAVRSEVLQTSGGKDVDNAELVCLP